MSLTCERVLNGAPAHDLAAPLPPTGCTNSTSSPREQQHDEHGMHDEEDEDQDDDKQCRPRAWPQSDPPPRPLRNRAPT